MIILPRRGASNDTQAIHFDANEEPKGSAIKTTPMSLSLKKYNEDRAKLTDFFTQDDPTEVINQITEYLKENNHEYKVSENSFKVTFTVVK